MRPTQDNVLIELEKLPDQTAGGLFVPDMGKKDSRRKNTAVRWARVLAVGPGHIPGCRNCGGQHVGAFIATELCPGDRVLVDAVAGQDYSADLTAPRHHKKALAFDGVAGYRGELRIVREGEVIAIDEDGSCAPTERDPDVGCKANTHSWSSEGGGCGCDPHVYAGTGQE